MVDDIKVGIKVVVGKVELIGVIVVVGFGIVVAVGLVVGFSVVVESEGNNVGVVGLTGLWVEVTGERVGDGTGEGTGDGTGEGTGDGTGDGTGEGAAVVVCEPVVTTPRLAGSVTVVMRELVDRVV